MQPRRTLAEQRAAEAARARAVTEDAEFLARTGVAIYDAAPRLGFATPRALDKYLRRWKRGDLIAALNRNNLPGIPTGRNRPATPNSQEARAS